MNWVARRLEGRLHYGWIVVGVVFFVLLAAAGTRATPSVMMLPLEKQFGWSRGTISLAILTVAIVVAVLGFVVHFLWVGALVLMGVLWGVMVAERQQRQGTVRGLAAEMVTTVVEEAKGVMDATTGSDPAGTRWKLSQRWRSNWVKGGVVLAMVGVTVAACLAFNFNPRAAYYLPLLAPVLISAVLFGFGASLFSVIVGIVAADVFFAPPVFDFAMTEWEDALGLATFGIIGALVGLAIDEFFSFPD